MGVQAGIPRLVAFNIATRFRVYGFRVLALGYKCCPSAVAIPQTYLVYSAISRQYRSPPKTLNPEPYLEGPGN